MKNFKKVLALVLVLATLLGLATMASATEYKDADKIAADYDEAVKVLDLIETMQGYPDGNFKPTATITREEAAKVIAIFDNKDADISTYYTFSGNLSTKDSQIVTSTAKTTVKECLFSEGDVVKKNDIILKFSSGGTARAPMDGTLSNLYVEEGDEVTMGQQLLRVADYSNPQIVFNVDEYDRPALSVGQAADVTVLSTGKMLTGTITRIAQEATVSGDLAYYEVTMTVPQDGTLAMGLSCEIRVLYQSVKNVTTVSIDAIQYDSDGKPFVYCYDRKDDIVQQRVTLGINNGSIVEIVDGIRTGEAVLIPVKNPMEMPMMHY